MRMAIGDTRNRSGDTIQEAVVVLGADPALDAWDLDERMVDRDMGLKNARLAIREHLIPCGHDAAATTTSAMADLLAPRP